MPTRSAGNRRTALCHPGLVALMARDPDAFMTMVLGQQMPDWTPASRELYLRKAFEPLLSALEQFVTRRSTIS